MEKLSLEDRSLLSVTQEIESLTGLFEFFEANPTAKAIAQNSKGKFWPSMFVKFGLQDELLSRLDMKNDLYSLAQALQVENPKSWTLQFKVNMATGKISRKVHVVEIGKYGPAESEEDHDDDFYTSVVIKGVLPGPGIKVVLQEIQNFGIRGNGNFIQACFAETYEEMKPSLLSMATEVFREKATQTLVIREEQMENFEDWGADLARYAGDPPFVQGQDLEGLEEVMKETFEAEEGEVKFTEEIYILIPENEDEAQAHLAEATYYKYDSFVIQHVFDSLDY